MKVVFTKTGEIKDVSDGYARNYLLPKGEAVAATKDAVADAESKQQAHAAELAAKKAEWDSLAEKLKSTPVHITADANDEGTLFGGIDEAAIAAAAAGAGVAVEADWVKLGEHIKKTGAHTVTVAFPNGEKSELTLSIDAK